MASIFLVNDNKIVSRLLQLSSEKHGYLLEEKAEPEPSRDHYDVVLVDSDSYSPELIETLKNKITFDKLGYIGVKKEEVPPEFEMHLDKPFLPSDFVTLIDTHTASHQETTQAPLEEAEEKRVLSEEVNLEEETLSLDIEEVSETEATPDIDALLEEQTELPDLEENLDALEELDDIDDLSLDDLTVESETTKTDTENEPEADAPLKDLDKTEDALKELEALDEDLENLDELDENVDLSLDASAVMSTGIAEQFIEESAQEEQPSLHEVEEQAAEKLEEQEESSGLTSAALAAGAGIAAATAAAMTEQEQIEEETENEALSSLDNLKSAEDIEHESDYIEEKLTVDDLAQDFDTLNEAEVLKALDPDAQIAEPTPQTVMEKSEEIIQEEIITEGEETMVESNDVEKWIRDAVAKAITPEMIQEALQDMEITVKLDFKKRDNA
jgi:uncharacterized membrane protein